MTFIFISGRSTKQGQQINIGKSKPAYDEMVSGLQINAQDLAELGVSPGDALVVRTLWGEAQFRAITGDLPRGIVFALYGPPTCKLMGGTTEASGMPIQKGFEVIIERAETALP